MITSEPEELRRPELAVVEHVFRSGSFILGTEVRQFEEVWANFCDMKFCVGVTNEIESIELGLRALSIGPGDEVVTTPMTATATVLTIMHAGATPVLAEVAIVIQHQNVLTVKTKCVAMRSRSWF